jgi:hypothetical protein
MVSSGLKSVYHLLIYITVCYHVHRNGNALVVCRRRAVCRLRSLRDIRLDPIRVLIRRHYYDNSVIVIGMAALPRSTVYGRLLISPSVCNPSSKWNSRGAPRLLGKHFLALGRTRHLMKSLWEREARSSRTSPSSSTRLRPTSGCWRKKIEETVLMATLSISVQFNREQVPKRRLLCQTRTSVLGILTIVFLNYLAQNIPFCSAWSLGS